jgi:sugar lactone lactonase YvrE
MKKIVFICSISTLLLTCKKQNETASAPQNESQKKGTIITYAGAGITGTNIAQVVQIPNLRWPTGITSDNEDNIFISDTYNHTIYRVSKSAVLSSVFGNGLVDYSGEGVQATAAGGSPNGLATDKLGNVFFADSWNQRVNKVSSTGVLSTIAGNGIQGFSGDSGLATSATLKEPIYLTVDSKMNIFVADNLNRRIRKINSLGIISTLIGSNGSGYSGDGGPVSLAKMGRAYGVCADKQNNIYFADVDNCTISKIDTMGIITTIAGKGVSGFSGDGGPAIDSKIGTPRGICIDKDNNLYFVDLGNKRIRRINSSGIIETVAGGGANSVSDSSPQLATSFQFQSPQGICVDSEGNIYVADFNMSRVLKIFMK